MKKVSDLFTAQAYNPWEVANMSNGGAGFRIPEYQRTYDWSKANLHRLMTDIFTGFERLSHGADASAYTFLGTLILVKDPIKKEKFKGRSYSIVDGQQRLTTLTLLACALIERLRILKHDIPKFSPETTYLLNTEVESLEEALASCVRGIQIIQHGKENFRFPRIVRDKDFRGGSKQEEELRSEIALFLSAFVEFIQDNKTEFLAPDLGNTREAEIILKNYREIKQLCKSLNDSKWYAENDCIFLDAKRFSHGGYVSLWRNTQDVDRKDWSKAISEIEKEPEAHSYFRTLMLAAYFCNCVAVTTVITDDETAAFDIFDALNTTGEPLTALETLKPHVINTLNKPQHNGYSGSRCEIAFGEIDKIMATNFPETKQKQDETKNLIITFALYLRGKKIPLNLSAQRGEILNYFNSNISNDEPTKFIEILAKLTEFRCYYWHSKNIGIINNFHNDYSEAEQVKLLCSLINATKTHLTLPILARYWIDGKEKNDFSDFLKVLKAVAAFLVLRRAATGATDGIDTCFRDIMEEGDSPKKFGLCTGPNFSNTILTVSDLKKALLSKLGSRKVQFNCKEEWISNVMDTPIYSHSQPLARFLLLSASHNTAQDKNDPRLLTREGILPGADRRYLDYNKWIGEEYKTVEHVAPNSDNPEGWNQNIYSNPRIRNTLGNLVLLPTKENSAVGRASWKKKKLFYTALADENEEERKAALEGAKREGLPFHKTTENLITKGKRLSMLEGISDVKDWDKEFIEIRTRRLASLAWDKLRPWLD